MAPNLAAAHPRSSDQLPPTLLEQPRTLRRATPLQQHLPNPRRTLTGPEHPCRTLAKPPTNSLCQHSPNPRKALSVNTRRTLLSPSTTSNPLTLTLEPGPLQAKLLLPAPTKQAASPSSNQQSSNTSFPAPSPLLHRYHHPAPTDCFPAPSSLLHTRPRLLEPPRSRLARPFWACLRPLRQSGEPSRPLGVAWSLVPPSFSFLSFALHPQPHLVQRRE